MGKLEDFSEELKNHFNASGEEVSKVLAKTKTVSNVRNGNSWNLELKDDAALLTYLTRTKCIELLIEPMKSRELDRKRADRDGIEITKENASEYLVEVVRLTVRNCTNWTNRVNFNAFDGNGGRVCKRRKNN